MMWNDESTRWHHQHALVKGAGCSTKWASHVQPFCPRQGVKAFCDRSVPAGSKSLYFSASSSISRKGLKSGGKLATAGFWCGGRTAIALSMAGSVCCEAGEDNFSHNVARLFRQIAWGCISHPCALRHAHLENSGEHISVR